MDATADHERLHRGMPESELADQAGEVHATIEKVIHIRREDAPRG